MVVGIKGFKHRYTCNVALIALELFKKGLGYRQIENVFKIFYPYTMQKAPSDSSIRLWIMRIGHFKLHKPIPTGSWNILADVTVDVGKVKCLLSVGVDLNKFQIREDYTLKLTDLEIVGINPTKKSTGLFAYEAFKDGIERLGGVSAVRGLVTDEGSDVKKGGKLLQSENPELKVFFDISHKLALVLEKELKNDLIWIEYMSQLVKTKRLVHLTELAALQPPNQRSKARFMNVNLYIKWPNRILESKAAGRLDSISAERYEEYFGWLSGYTHWLTILEKKVEVVEIVKNTIRKNGLSKSSYNFLLTLIEKMNLEVSMNEFVCKVFKEVNEEVEKLDEGQVVIAFTEIVESLFGSFKNQTEKGGQGITGNALTLGALVGQEQSAETIYEALTETSVDKMLSWVGNNVGETYAKLRNKFFSKKKIFVSQSQAVAFG